MIMKKTWNSKEHRQGLFGFIPKYVYTGYFVFGVLPIFISRKTNY